MRNLSKWLLENREAFNFDHKLGLYVRQYFAGLLGDPAIAAMSITPTTTKTSLLTPLQANLYLPLPYGTTGASVPFAGQVFRFALGGLITTPSSGTLVVDPYHGPGTSATAFGTDLGASPAQTMTVSLSSIPWWIEGHLVYRSISSAATGSTAWITGSFFSQGTLATAGSGWSIPFGSTAAVSVDTTGGGSAGTFGALNFAVTFSVTGGTISTQWTAIYSLN
jgi:hypothetical protein